MPKKDNSNKERESERHREEKEQRAKEIYKDDDSGQIKFGT